MPVACAAASSVRKAGWRSCTTRSGSLGGAARSCEKSIAAAAVPTWILIVLGIALVMVGIIIRAIGKNRVTASVAAPAEPTIASRLEDLARLKEQGLISVSEYDLKRTELMRQL